MALPEPVPALVIRYSYLWKVNFDRGQEEGVKDRPCAVILVSVDREGDRVVTVLPISHTPPADPALAVELPAATKRRLGLDDERSWVVLTEANRLLWPGPDLRPAPAVAVPKPVHSPVSSESVVAPTTWTRQNVAGERPHEASANRPTPTV